MPFLTAGDPDMDATVRLIDELSSLGVDLIEVGFPYSDPIADGPVIQASYTRALERGLKVDDIFGSIGTLNPDSIAPLVAMVSCAIIFRTGLEAFCLRAKDCGFSGLIVPDLPGDEARETYEVARSARLDLIQLIAPTTPPDRATRILKTCSGFVYCISVAGTTGVRDELPSELSDHLSRLRAKTDLPLAVGFGVSRPDQVRSLRGLADGVIVGSAIVRQVEESSGSVETAASSVGDFARAMIAAVRES